MKRTGTPFTYRMMHKTVICRSSALNLSYPVAGASGIVLSEKAKQLWCFFFFCIFVS